MAEEIPRKTVETDPSAQLWATVRELEKAVSGIQRSATLRNASISGGDGIRLLAENSAAGEVPALRIWIHPNGTITAYDVNTGAPVVRMGLMVETGGGPGNDPYGIEVFVNGAWMQLGNQTTTWDSVSGKPATFPTGSHTHAGGDITSPVANAVNATNAGHANTSNASSVTNGSQYAFDNTVSGSTFYAVWVGNDGGYHLGRNTSSKRYKQNVRARHNVDKSILNVELVDFDRKEYDVPPPEGTIGPSNRRPGRKNEFGVIAEQAHTCFPEATQFYEGQIDGVRYELYGVALIPIVREHDQRLDRLEKLVADQAAEIERLKGGN